MRRGAGRVDVRSPAVGGLGLALVSAAAFGTAGPLAKGLITAGWSAPAVAFARLAGTAVLLAVPLAVVLVARRGAARRPGGARAVVIYGVVALAGAQLCYFSAVRTLPVGVALLLEYLAPVLLLVWTSARTRTVPHAATLVGAVLAVGGLGLVVDPGGPGTVDVGGIAWAVGAAVCMAGYFQLSGAADTPPPLELTALGALVGAVAVAAVAATGLVPFVVTTGTALLADRPTPWWVVVLLVAGVSTALAYLTGIAAITRLGSRLASFVGLGEVLCAVLAAWWLLGEVPTAVQSVGGVVVVGAIALVRASEHRSSRG